MIRTAEEFVRLRASAGPADHARASRDEAEPGVWEAVCASHPDLRFWVAQNKTVPLHILEDLARDPDDEVRFMVASKRKLSVALQLLLAADPECSVRAALARNPKLAEAARTILSADTHPLVTGALRRNSATEAVRP